MLGKLEDSPQLATLTQATKTAKLTYNPSADPRSQFTWITEQDDSEHSRPFLFVDEDNTTVTITLEGEGAAFAQSPFTFIAGAENLVPGPPQGANEVSFTVRQAPENYFNPLLLSFNIDNGAVKGINSPPLYIVRQPTSANAQSVTLQYSTSDGSFILDSMSGVLASLDLLVNVIVPFTIEIKLNADPGVTFHPQTPIIGPRWLEITSFPTPTKLVISIPKDPPGFASVQFILNVNGVKVVSPDPIIVNATIGDGTLLQLGGEGRVRPRHRAHQP